MIKMACSSTCTKEETKSNTFEGHIKVGSTFLSSFCISAFEQMILQIREVRELLVHGRDWIHEERLNYLRFLGNSRLIIMGGPPSYLCRPQHFNKTPCRKEWFFLALLTF